MASSDRTAMLRRALTHYLLLNAQACDSATGMARWWMPGGLEVGEAELLPVLEELRGRGLLTRFSTPDGTWLYRRRLVDADSDHELAQMTKDSNELH